MKITINFYCLFSREKTNGLVPIYCILKKGSETARFSTKLSIPKTLWDKSRNVAKGKSDEAMLVNEQLDIISKKMKQHILNSYSQGNEITINELLETYFHKKVGNPRTLMEVYKHKFEKMHKLLGQDYTQSTLSKYSQMAKVVQEFINTEYNSKDIQLNKLNRPFLDDLELFLRTNKAMKPISSNKVIQGLKSVVRYALERDWIEKNPFIGHSFKRVDTEIKYLTKEQIDLLEQNSLF